MQTTTKNEEILQEKIEQFNKVEGPRVGDFLKLPYGLFTRFTHVWDNVLQTGGAGSSFHLGAGSCSYSGGLDKGVTPADIRPTDQTRKGWIWIWDGGISGAGRGVDFEIDFRVYETIEGADLSGCPQVAAYEKAQYLETVEKVMLVNGNKQPYTVPVPEIWLKGKDLSDVVLNHIEANTGLKFTPAPWDYYKAQPTNSGQITALLLTYNFVTKYYNNSDHKNQLHIEFNIK